jgi:hypothetical protein
MVCIVEHAPTQSLSRSSSFKGIRSPRGTLGPNTARFERALNPPQVIATDRQASISPERLPVEPYEERIVEALKELYSCSPSSVRTPLPASAEIDPSTHLAVELRRLRARCCHPRPVGNRLYQRY